MSIIEFQVRHSSPSRRKLALVCFRAVLTLLCFVAPTCHGQGTMTITFQGAPPGEQIQIGAYTDASGMQFNPLTPQRLYLNGGGIPGYPDNGTCYLENPDGSIQFSFT